MARMIPDYIDDAVPSAAERRIFELIRRDLGEEWIALHSLGLAHHATLPWAEIDFVLIGPPGVFCLEIKGGRVAFKDGLWHFTNRYGETSTKHRGPFEQVGPASSALFNRLREQLPGLPLLVGYGVVTPDIRFAAEGPDIIPEVIYDEDDRELPFAVYLERLADYWRRRRGRELPALSRVDVEAVRDRLRPDFDLRPSLRARVRRAVDELLALTIEQYAVLDGLAENPRVIVSGGAGTGKTLLAVEEAQRHARQGRKVGFFCFNKQLAGFLRRALAAVPGCDVYHLHGYLAQLVAEVGYGDRLPQQAPNLFTELYPNVALEILLAPDRFQPYDVLIVDEAQDLLHVAYLDVFDGLVKDGLDRGWWRFFLDPYQNLYDRLDESAAARLEVGRPTRWKLGTNCRNTTPVGVTTSLLSGIRDAALLKVDGPAVEEHWWRDERHQARLVARCVNRLLSDGLLPHDITILSPRRFERSAVRVGLDDVPAKLVDLADTNGERPGRAIGFSTVHAFKGLESDAVLLVDLDDLGATQAAAVYVGASRARSFLAVFIDERQRDIYADRSFRYGRMLAGSAIDGSD